MQATANLKKALLLGNGFSRALFDDIFSYQSLLKNADFQRLSKFARVAFDELNTTDFEAIIKALQDSSKLISLYDGTQKELIEQMKVDSLGIKKVLVETITSHHPEAPNLISEEEYEACRSFLSSFQKTYTLNYDLLLYWVYMHFIDDKEKRLNFNDGFQHPEGEDDAEYVVWGEGTGYTQTMFYLHGALHLFDCSAYLQKYTWSRTGIKLKGQINSALDKDAYPLVVAEGESQQKYTKIRKSDYLSKCYRSLKTTAGTFAIFVYGMSMSDNDDHILKAIRLSNVKQLWVGFYGDDLNSEFGQQLQNKMNSLAEKRPEKKPLDIFYYCAKSANIWGKT